MYQNNRNAENKAFQKNEVFPLFKKKGKNLAKWTVLSQAIMFQNESF